MQRYLSNNKWGGGESRRFTTAIFKQIIVHDWLTGYPGKTEQTPGKQRTAPRPRLHEDIGSCVWQTEPHQTAANQHGRCQQDGDGLCDANQRAKDQVAQHRCQFTHGVTEAKACAPENQKNTEGESDAWHWTGTIFFV